MPEITLSKGCFATVDDEDVEFLIRWKWCLLGNGGYAIRWSSRAKGIKKQAVFMHREIFFRQNPTADTSMEVDHRDQNKLNNRRDNLRLCTNSQQCQNKKIRSHNKSGYIGVSWHKHMKLWRATVCVNGKQTTAGYYDNARDAALKRDELARMVHGEFAVFNFPGPGEISAL